jgi:Ni2+-binding GTPase involved in maturation of urease and hydrogenase
MNKALYLMIGGFLGAGKTTAILQIARKLNARGLRVGLITNDQSVGLVDTAVLSHGDFPVEEITGGCFCCRFNSLVEASDKLSESTRPDVFIAEPVGSCTDLIAAVSFPLRAIYGEQFRVAPLSVLVDPIRAERMLGLAQGGNFSPKVRYVFGKQLEEAEILVINKSDLLDDARRDRLTAAMEEAYPGSPVVTIAARSGDGLDAWLDRILTEEGLAESAPEVDYQIYAEGEALLGWLNVSVTVASDTEIDGNDLLRRLAASVRQGLGADVEIAHLKMTLTPDEDGGDIGVLNLVRSDGTAELSHVLKAPITGGELLLNLRAEADPEVLHAGVLAALDNCGAPVKVEHLEHFRPGKPEPTYRMAHV